MSFSPLSRSSTLMNDGVGLYMSAALERITAGPKILIPVDMQSQCLRKPPAAVCATQHAIQQPHAHSNAGSTIRSSSLHVITVVVLVVVVVSRIREPAHPLPPIVLRQLPLYPTATGYLAPPHALCRAVYADVGPTITDDESPSPSPSPRHDGVPPAASPRVYRYADYPASLLRTIPP
ncbi:hypothetical protein MRB53_038060 [Persea americana]|nr:hypothetical protein MRB53_038060 [Persea americana]